MPDTLTAPPPAPAPAAVRGTNRFGGAGREISASALPGNPNRQPRNPTPPATPSGPRPSAPAPVPAPEPPPAPPTAPAPPAPASPPPTAADDRQARADKFAAEKAGQPPPAPADPNASQQAPPAPGSAPAAPEGGKGGKVSPWKLLDVEKAARAKAEAEIQQLKSSILPEADRTALTERVTKAEARARELEDHIRFVDYSKSSDFIEKYDKPYQAAFQRAVAELSEIPVVDAQTQQPRAATAQDLQTVLSLPLGEARALAKEVFGDFADDVMAHRKEIRSLLDQRSSALEEATKNGALRETQTREQQQRQMSEIVGFTRTKWQKANQMFMDDPAIGHLFKPKTPPEGQDATADEKAWNDRLASGYKLVDEGWAMTPMNPNLSEAQREAIVTRHAAIRARSAAFGPMRWQISQLEAKVKAMETELSQYAASNPAAGGNAPVGVPDANSDPRASRLQRAEEWARRRGGR